MCSALSCWLPKGMQTLPRLNGPALMMKGCANDGRGHHQAAGTERIQALQHLKSLFL